MNPTPETGPPPNYMRAWREHRGLSLGKMAGLTGLPKSSLSRIETGKIPYHRDILVSYARVVGCQPGDLISRPPAVAEDLFRMLAQCTPDELQRVEDVIKLFLQQQAQRKPVDAND